MKKDTTTLSLLTKVNALNDADISVSDEQRQAIVDKGETTKETKKDADDVEVIVREVVKDDTTEEATTTEETVIDDEVVVNYKGDSPAVGDEVNIGDEVAEDGEYTFNTSDDTEESVYVKDGVIAAIGDEAIADLMKKVVQGGKVVKKKVVLKKKRMSAKQKAGLKKAQKKAHSASAKKARAKSMKVRKSKIAASTDTSELESTQTQEGIDLDKLGDSLLEKSVVHLKEKLNLGDKEIDFLDEVMTDSLFRPELSDNTLSVTVPVWTEINDEVDLGDFEEQVYEIELQGDFTNDSVVEELMGESTNLLDQLVI